MDSKGITPYRVAKDTGITQATLSRWKTGVTEPSLDTLQTLADYFDVSVDFLLSGEQKENPGTQPGGKEKLPPAYFRFAKEAQELGLSEKTMEQLLAAFKDHQKRNE